MPCHLLASFGVFLCSSMTTLWGLSTALTLVFILFLELSSIWLFLFFHELGAYIILAALVNGSLALFSGGLLVKTLLAPLLLLAMPSLFEKSSSWAVAYILTINSLPFSALIHQFWVTSQTLLLVVGCVVVSLGVLSNLANPFLIFYLSSGVTSFSLSAMSGTGVLILLTLYSFQVFAGFLLLGSSWSPSNLWAGLLFTWSPLTLSLLTKMLLSSYSISLGLMLLVLFCLLVVPGFYLIGKSGGFSKSLSFLLVSFMLLFLFISMLA